MRRSQLWFVAEIMGSVEAATTGKATTGTRPIIFMMGAGPALAFVNF
jgi:hypothetical protein